MSTTTVDIAIPSTSLVTTPKLHTVYHVSLRLPLRSFTVYKRYSDFITLQGAITSQAGASPPSPLPPKSFFSSTTHNEALTESRRVGLESYLRAVNESADSRWRDTSAWRAFLNLPSNSARSSAMTALRDTVDRLGESGASDPVIWLDVHRELKVVLQEARLYVASRDQTDTISASHEEAAAAKKALVHAGTLITSLDSGLKAKMEAWGNEMLGEGEVHRRRDLVETARKEKLDLERLLTAMVEKGQLDLIIESQPPLSRTAGPITTAGRKKGGRVLGKETEKTMKLDNSEIVQLQKQMMEEQDVGIGAIGDVVRRQKELAIQINEELSIQDDILDMLDEDVNRTDSKIEVAKKRVDRIT